eukprot:12421199-Alexandrium_andersonii.AAC.1
MVSRITDRRLGDEIEVELRALAGTSVSVSCLVVRAGEAKLRECGRGEAAWAGERNEPSVAGATTDQMIFP